MRQKRKKSRESVASAAKLWYYEWAPTERYRSGCGGIDSKFLEAPAVSSAENVRRTGLCAGSDFTISYRSCVFFLHSSKCSINIKDTWRGIEVVITGLTRNQFASNRTWVRIPNSPPKTQSYQGFCPYDWAFLFSQGHIGVHDFRQELRCASRSALCPAESGDCPLHLPR